MLQMRILIVDGSKSLQTFLCQLFENFSFDVRYIKTADEPQAALKIAATLKPDFLLTDWFATAALSGPALHQQILAFNPACQFALLSTEVGPEQTQGAEDAGALFLLAKPCTAAQLRTAIGKALQQVAKKNPAVDAQARADRETAGKFLSTLKAATQFASFATGDRVRYKGRTETVKHTILRRGELMVQLQGMTGMVSAEDVQRA